MKVSKSIRRLWFAILLSLVFTSVTFAPAGAFLVNQPMNTARYQPCATLLQNGKLLVMGSSNTNGYLSTAELYDPATGQWAFTGSMNIKRTDFTATLLTNGKVLVTGGYGEETNLVGDENLVETNTAELYDPITGSWSYTGAMSGARLAHNAVLLTNGEVMVCGGVLPRQGFSQLASAELYDPASGLWTNTGSMHTPREYYTLTRLNDGKVLAIGGSQGSTVFNSVETYDPATGVWTTNSPINVARYYHSATLLPNGKVLVAGGLDTNFFDLASVELYDPVTGTSTITNSMTVSGAGTATLLPDGNVLLNLSTYVGGDYNNGAEIYDSIAGTWSPFITQNTGPAPQVGTLMANGRVIFSGGDATREISSTSNFSYFGPVPFADSVSYDSTINPATGVFLTNAPMNTARGPTSAILLPNGQALVVGGWNASQQPLASTEIFDLSSKTWSNTAPLITARSGNTLSLLPNGKVLAAAGVAAGGNALNSAELYDSTSGTWTNTGALQVARIEPVAALLPNGKLLVAGGDAGNGSNLLSSAEIYDPASGAWTLTGAMNAGRVAATATLLSDGRVLVTGGASSLSGNPLVSAEVYDAALGAWTNTGSLNVARAHHTATLLPSGLVLVAGGSDANGDFLASSELFNPQTGSWSTNTPMNAARSAHSATLLPDGRVLVAGGINEPVGTNAVPSAELFDPATQTWTPVGELNDATRSFHVAVLLPNEQVLIAGDVNASSSTELFDAGLGYSNSWQPQISSITSPVALNQSLMISGTQFRGISGGSSGGLSDSPADYPVVQLRNMESGRTLYLLSTNWSMSTFASVPITNFPPGYALVTVFVNGIPSPAAIINISAPMPTPTSLTNLHLTANGAIQFAFTNAPGALFGVMTTTNPALPLTNWTALGGVTEISPGQFQFTDSPSSSAAMQRFYYLRAP